MAIGSVISNRNFGSFIGSGRVFQTNHAVVHNKRDSLQLQGKMFYQTLCTPRANGSISRNSYNPYLGASFSSDANTRLLHDEGNRRYVMSLQSGIRCQSIVTKQRTIGRCEGYLSSNHSFKSFNQSRKLDKLDNWQYQKSESVKVNRIRADYKPEDIDITETEVDSLTGSGEAVLANGKVPKVSAWWEIPKRWVIVLLCFTAYTVFDPTVFVTAYTRPHI